MSKKRIGDELIDRQIITEDQLEIALAKQKEGSAQIGRVLIDLGFLTELLLKSVIEDSRGDQSIDLSEIVPDQYAIEFISKSDAARLIVLPCDYRDGVLTIAMPDTFNVLVLDKVKALLPRGTTIKAVMAGQAEIEKAIDDFYGHELSIDGILKEIETGEFTGGSGEYSHPVVRLVNAFLTDAVKQDASDIHFEPEEGFLRIRYRLDGVLRQVRSLHDKYWPAISVRLKVISNMDLAESRASQDGRIQLKVAGHPIDFRVASQLTLHGENFVLRVLNRDKSIIPLNDLDIDPVDREALKRLVATPHGIVLVTGPTGSGKTTTLYSLINYLNNESVNIMTLEDPIEYPMRMIRQSSVKPKMGFADGIRSLMRQDPDIIMVGEIRDHETAEMAFQAAMTGHQVFSTLHTSSAVGVFPRLGSIGVDPDIISGNLTGIIGQRLIRKLCSCKIKEATTQVQADLLNCDRGDVIYTRSVAGCSTCSHTGYKGRLALMEVLELSDEIDDIISTGGSARLILKQAEKEGFKSLAHQGRRTIMNGVSSLDEISRVINLSSRGRA